MTTKPAIDCAIFANLKITELYEYDPGSILGRIEILPEAQGRGIGTAVIRDLLGRGRVVRLHVFTNNVRARRLYEKLGFSVDRHAEREGRISMLHLGEAIEDSQSDP